jgi:hypothetical protein
MKECSTPSSAEVTWYVLHRASGRATIVSSRTWMAARDDGAKTLGVDRYDVTCERRDIVKA